MVGVNYSPLLLPKAIHLPYSNTLPVPRIRTCFSSLARKHFPRLRGTLKDLLIVFPVVYGRASSVLEYSDRLSDLSYDCQHIETHWVNELRHITHQLIPLDAYSYNVFQYSE